MRRVLFVFAIIILTQSITDRQILQQILNGGFQENGLPNPKTIMPCVDDATAHTLVLFFGDFLARAAVGSSSDLTRLFNVLNDFVKDIPQPVQDCLRGNQQREALYVKYGVSSSSNFTEVNKKYVTYLTLHYLQVHKWFGQTNTLWIAKNYYQVGFNTGSFAHKILIITEHDQTEFQEFNQFKDYIQEPIIGDKNLKKQSE